MSNFNITPVFFLQFFGVLGDFSSVVLSCGSGLLWAYCHSSVFRSGRVPNLAISLLRTLTSGTPGSLIAVVVGDVLTAVLLGASVSQSPLKSRFERLENFWARISSRDRSVSDIGLVNFGWRINLETDLFLSPMYHLPASTWAFVMSSSTKISLLFPVTQPLPSK